MLRRGTARARIGQVAAVLREYSVDGVHYTETWPDEQTPPMGCGIVLMPWPNRVAGATWRHEGAEMHLDVTERGRGNAIHGLLRNTAYQPVPDGDDSPRDAGDVTVPQDVGDAAVLQEAGDAAAGQEAGDAAAGKDADGTEDDTITLAAPVYPQHGWPFSLETAVTYALTDDGLRVTHRVRNVGESAAVFGCGAHPYLRIGGVPTEELTLTIRARRRIVTDDRMIPVGTTELDGALAELPAGVRVGDLDVDTGLADLDSVGDRFEHVLTGPQGRRVTLWADPAFAWAQLYTPHDFPAPEGPRQAVAVEPMTCPADALNSGEGLIVLAPGRVWSASWGISPIEG